MPTTSPSPAATADAAQLIRAMRAKLAATCNHIATISTGDKRSLSIKITKALDSIDPVRAVRQLADLTHHLAQELDTDQPLEPDQIGPWDRHLVIIEDARDAALAFIRRHPSQKAAAACRKALKNFSLEP